jgi:hypothetical protein
VWEAVQVVAGYILLFATIRTPLISFAIVIATTTAVPAAAGIVAYGAFVSVVN